MLVFIHTWSEKNGFNASLGTVIELRVHPLLLLGRPNEALEENPLNKLSNVTRLVLKDVLGHESSKDEPWMHFVSCLLF